MSESSQPSPEARAPRQRLGRLGEEAAALAYAAAGAEVLHRRWRRAEGELDLVLRRGGLLIFCEVKTRRSGACGPPEAAVGPRRLQRMRRLARRFLAEESPCGAAEFRFDVAAVRVAPPPGGLVVEILAGVG